MWGRSIQKNWCTVKPHLTVLAMNSRMTARIMNWKGCRNTWSWPNSRHYNFHSHWCQNTFKWPQSVTKACPDPCLYKQFSLFWATVLTLPFSVLIYGAPVHMAFPYKNLHCNFRNCFWWFGCYLCFMSKSNSAHT